MKIIYYAHSYREEDTKIVEFFGSLVRDEGLLPSLDPPSNHLNSAKPEKHLRATDGMIAILTVRNSGVSPYIMYEISLAVRAHKPIIVFIEDVLPNFILPTRILQRRFSRKGLLRQIRDIRYALRTFKNYLGEEPPPKYHLSFQKRSCVLTGLMDVPKKLRDDIVNTIDTLNYTPNIIDSKDFDLLHNSEFHELLASSEFAVCFIDSNQQSSAFTLGTLYGLAVPSILITFRESYKFHSSIPIEYQARVSQKDIHFLNEILHSEVGIMEEEYVDLENQEEVQRYTDLLVSEASGNGRYTDNVRKIFVNQLIMRDQFNNSGTAGAIGPNAQGTVNFGQAWQQINQTVDVEELSKELSLLRLKLKQKAETLEQEKDVLSIHEAEEEAKKGNGPKALEYLSKAGKWVLDAAKEIGVKLAFEALKQATNLS